MPGIVCGRMTSRKLFHQFAAEVARRLERAAVDLGEHEEQRRDHEQDVELDQASVTEQPREAEDLERLVDQPDLLRAPG